MEPTLHQGDKVLVVKTWFLQIKPQTIVVFYGPQNRRLLVKRVREIKGKYVFVVGDNKQESTDSRDFGWIDKKYIFGKVINIS